MMFQLLELSMARNQAFLTSRWTDGKNGYKTSKSRNSQGIPESDVLGKAAITAIARDAKALRL
jgi:hypothetical protein